MSRTAREEFLYLFGDADAGYIDDFLAKHAHELAEVIRHHDGGPEYGCATWEGGHGCDFQSCHDLAALIDPEINN